MNKKRILAIIAIVLLVAMYLITLVLAFLSFPGSERLLQGFILLDIAAPIFLWILIYIYKRFGDRNDNE